MRLALRIVLVPLYFPFGLILASLGIRFVTSRVAAKNFGHQALDPIMYVASELVGGHPSYRAVMLAPRWRVVNRALLDYWRPRFNVIDNSMLAFLLTPFHWIPPVRFQIYAGDTRIRAESGEVLEGGFAEDEVLRLYAEQMPGQPLAELTIDHQKRGRGKLRSLGMPDGSWWVALHVREGGWNGPRIDAHRNIDPATYFEAISEITGRGGWVVRIGDDSMRQLPKMDNVIDYAHSEAKSDWMDVFLIGGCRFLLGSSSGTTAVALMFGRPAVVANQIPMGHALWTDMIFIPKLYQSKSEGRLLTFEEVLSSSRRDWSSDQPFIETGIGWRDNTPEEIRDLTNEMMDRLDGRFTLSDEDDSLQSDYWSLFSANRTRTGWGTRSRIGRQFLRDHADLL